MGIPVSSPFMDPMIVFRIYHRIHLLTLRLWVVNSFWLKAIVEFLCIMSSALFPLLRD